MKKQGLKIKNKFKQDVYLFKEWPMQKKRKYLKTNTQEKFNWKYKLSEFIDLYIFLVN